MGKKLGLPEDHALEATSEGVTEVANLGDFLDEFEPTTPRRSKPGLAVVDGGLGGGGEAAVVAPKLGEQEPAPSPAPTREPKPKTPRAKRPAKKAEVEPTVVVNPRKRPPRKEIGFDPETLQMLSELHRDGMDQSAEENLSRSEVSRAALRAVREARNHIDYSTCGRRGKWGSSTQRALQDDLTEAYIRAIGKLYIERYHRTDDV